MLDSGKFEASTSEISLEAPVDRTSSDIFGAPAPRIHMEENTAAGTKWNGDFATVEWEDISEWEDFDNVNINQLLKETMNESLPWTLADDLRLRMSREKTYVIRSEADINSMFYESMVDPVTKSMNHACAKTRMDLETKPFDLEIKYEGASIRISKEKVSQEHRSSLTGLFTGRPSLMLKCSRYTLPAKLKGTAFSILPALNTRPRTSRQLHTSP